MPNELFREGLMLMVAGMGTVFVFLTILVIAMSVMSMLLARLQPAGQEPSGDEVAAIAAAIRQHRRQKQSQ